jgi:Mor family transcriptional regulator
MSWREDDLQEYLVNCMTTAMQSAGIDQSLAKTIAEQVEGEIRMHFGGERHYVKAPSKRDRNRMILRDWRAGVDRNAIAEKLGVHRSTIDRVISDHLLRQHVCSDFGSPEWNL